MKVVFVSPYIKLLHTGGGEKHLLDVALALPRSAKIYLAVPTEADVSEQEFEKKVVHYRETYEAFMGLSLGRIHFIRSPLFTEAPWYTKLFWTRSFDYLYFVTDGSLFFSLAGRNLLHIQTPLLLQNHSWAFKLKSSQWQKINTNSEFTKSIVEKYWKLKVDQVIYPAIDARLFSQRGEKKNIILSVGRFFPQLHSKRQEIIVEAFLQLLKEQPRLFQNWQLVLVGTVENADYFNKIKKLAGSAPIVFETDLDRVAVQSLYAQARIFWHASGYQVDPERNPEKVEHFGISTVEAMAAGAIPMVIPSGGQMEAIPPELQDYTWNNISQLVNQTTRLVRDPKQEARLRTIITSRAREFSMATLEKNVRKFFYE
ncbi:glycosyltransferase family 4 protein [Candidatus Woesebacteria bacterium]|nr:glycosyltransferase family 4 protein [Candidatus Woesebacteria bacterium]